MTTRRDIVVIMARGNSSRMGQPKGLLACPGAAGESFVACIVAAYEQIGLGGLVVCGEPLVPQYRAALRAAVGFRVLGGPTGGETGLTLALAWRGLEESVTHIWAHPVDLPLVKAPTLLQLHAASREAPCQVVRPSFQLTPGHPVIMPARILAEGTAGDLWATAPMRDIIARSFDEGKINAPVLVAVPDNGVVSDFDEPGDLRR